MKKITLSVLSIVLAASVALAQSFPADGKIYAQGYGDRTSATINALLARIGSAEATMVCGAGEWVITANVTFPANVTLEIPYGSSMAISTGIVFTVNGPFDAGVYTAFSGLGTAAGSALFPYRYTQWGDVVQYNIGTGQIQSLDIETVLDNGSDAGGGSVTNLITVQAVTGNFDVVNTGDLTATGTVTFTGPVDMPGYDYVVIYETNVVQVNLGIQIATFNTVYDGSSNMFNDATNGIVAPYDGTIMLGLNLYYTLGSTPVANRSTQYLYRNGSAWQVDRRGDDQVSVGNHTFTMVMPCSSGDVFRVGRSWDGTQGASYDGIRFFYGYMIKED